MKEYKIICNRTEENLRTGEIWEKEGTYPIIGNGTAFSRIFSNRLEATAELKRIKDECKRYDDNRKKNIERYGTDVYELSCTQTGLRIVSRTVTEWK